MPDQTNSEVYVRGPGGLLQRIRQRFSVPPEPELPEKMKPDNAFNPWTPQFLSTGAMDSSKIGTLSWGLKGRAANPKTKPATAADGNPIIYRKKGHRIIASKPTTLGDVSNVLFNEYRSLQGSNPKDPNTPYAGDEQLKKAKSDTAYAIFNDARYAPGTEVAPPVVNKKAQQSPEYGRDFKNYQNTVWNAFAGYVMGRDPVEGRGYYNSRPNNSMAPRHVGGKIDPQQTVYRRYGPFASSYGPRTPYVDIFNPPLNPDYAQRSRPDIKGKQQ
jgi:hypothetical protein